MANLILCPGLSNVMIAIGIEAISAAARTYIREAWWMSTFPGLAIMLVVLALNLFGDGLRDALDPRTQD